VDGVDQRSWRGGFRYRLDIIPGITLDEELFGAASEGALYPIETPASRRPGSAAAQVRALPDVDFEW
jgi:hypothetical protein